MNRIENKDRDNINNSNKKYEGDSSDSNLDKEEKEDHIIGDFEKYVKKNKIKNNHLPIKELNYNEFKKIIDNKEYNNKIYKRLGIS